MAAMGRALYAVDDGGCNMAITRRDFLVAIGDLQSSASGRRRDGMIELVLINIVAYSI